MSRIEPIKPAAKFRNPLRTKRNSLIAAVVIVAVSVVAINLAVKTLSGTKEYLVANAAAAAGTPLSNMATRSISLNLGAAGDDYLAPGEDLNGYVLSQPIAAGDLLLLRDIAPEDPNDEAVRITVTAKTALPSKLEAGSKVDLWAAVNDGGGQYGEPELIAQAVQVYAAGSSSGVFGDATNKLELSVAQRDVKPILTAVLHQDAMSIVAHEKGK